MINEIIKLAQASEWIGVSPEIEIAKGKYEIKKKWKYRVKELKRKFKTLWQRRKK